MRPLRTSELPLHRGSPNGKKKLGASLNHALEKGLDMAGLSKTKAGAGDKERAYIIRQNGALKCLLFIVLLIVVGNIFVFSTYLTISIERRDALHSEAIHRKVEHSAQLKLINMHMQLQKALDNEVHETVRIEEFRSQFEELLGRMMSETSKSVSREGTPAEVKTEVEKLQSDAYSAMVKYIDRLVNQFKGKASRAKTRLKEIAQDVIKDIEHEDEEVKRFKERIKELGATEDFDYNDEEGDLYDDNEADENHNGDEESVVKDLERFYKKLVDTKFHSVHPNIVSEWEAHLLKVIETLEDDSKETDLKGLENYVSAQLMQHVPTAAQFDPAKDRSIFDFFEAKIYEAKLAPHRQNLLEMYDGWKKGTLTPYHLLASIEKVANDEQLYLIYEWLSGFDEEEEFYEEDQHQQSS